MPVWRFEGAVPSESKVPVAGETEKAPSLQSDSSTVVCITQGSTPRPPRLYGLWNGGEAWIPGAHPRPADSESAGKGLGIQKSC